VHELEPKLIIVSFVFYYPLKYGSPFCRTLYDEKTLKISVNIRNNGKENWKHSCNSSRL